MHTLLSVIVYLAVSVLVGCLFGLVPFFLGRYRYRPNMGRWGFIWCGVAGPFLLPFLVMLGFVVAILVSEQDARPPREPQPVAYPRPAPRRVAEPIAQGGLTLTCLAGPLRGQSYPIGAAGLMFGRDTDCHVRFPSQSTGISRHHCAVRWQQGVPVLVDLNSAYGTYLGDGKQLPPNYPTPVGPGSRFYLGGPANLFQITV